MFTFFKGDVSVKADNIKAVETAIKVYGKLDIICANAGIYPLTWIKDISEKEWDHVMDINLKGPFFLLQSALDHFIQNKYGKVIFTSSITGTSVSASGHATLCRYKIWIAWISKNWSSRIISIQY